MGKYMVDVDMPMDTEHGPLHFTDGTLAYAGLHLHVDGHPMHTHRFVEVAFAVGGSGTHDCLAGRHPMTPDDVVLLRPGVLAFGLDGAAPRPVSQAPGGHDSAAALPA